MRQIKLVDQVVRDFRYGTRALVTNPGFAAVAVLTLALGIGANTAIFTVLYNTVLQPLPYADADRLVRVRGMAIGDRARPIAFPARSSRRDTFRFRSE